MGTETPGPPVADFYIQYRRSDWCEDDWRMWANVTDDVVTDQGIVLAPAQDQLTDARERFSHAGSSVYHFRLVRVESQIIIMRN